MMIMKKQRNLWWCVMASAFLPVANALEFKQWDPTPYSQIVTECDRLAGHPDDPFRVGPGVATRDVKNEAAIAACQVELVKDPKNPRVSYQLARVLTYAGKVGEAVPHIERAAATNYPQALFVTGYLYLSGAYEARKDACRAGELIRESGIWGRLAGQLGYPAFVLNGRFKGCAVNQDRAELIAFVEQARKGRLEYYPSVLAETLLRELQAAR
jgi:hypothetical protein